MINCPHVPFFSSISRPNSSRLSTFVSSIGKFGLGNCRERLLNGNVNGLKRGEQATDRNSFDDVRRRRSTFRNVSRGYSSDVRPDWTVRELLLRTCVDFWDERPDGANVVVGYVDTASQVGKAERREMPTVLAVPGNLGQSGMMSPMLEPLARSGFRVIMPHLLGTAPTRCLTRADSECFSNSLGERSTFLLDFIRAVEIPKFDLAIGHSLGCLPLVTLAASFPLFQRLALVCPVPGHVHPRWIHPLKMNFRMLGYWDNILVWPFVAAWFRAFVRFRVPALSSLSLEELRLFLDISLGVNPDAVPGLANAIESYNEPLLYIFCDEDPIVDGDQSKEFAELLGIQPQFTDVYDSNHELVEKGTTSSKRNAKAVRFSARTHVPQADREICDIITRELLELYHNTITEKSLSRI